MADLSAFQNVWCVADQRQGKVLSSVRELVSAGRMVADKLGEKLCVVLLGKGMASQAEEAGRTGADKIYVLDHESLKNFADEIYSFALTKLIGNEKPNKVFFTSSVLGKSLAARVAIQCKTGLACEAMEITVESEGHLTLRRSCGGGTMTVPVSCRKARPEMATLRLGAFPKAPPKDGAKAEIVQVPVDLSGLAPKTRFVEFEPEKSDEKDMTQTDIVVSGGFGVGGADGFSVIRDLARALGGAVGASRRAVDLGWIPYRHQVGLTGRTIRPKLYIACGISGQIQHLAGMSQSQTVVAVNKDPQAPLMKRADFAVEGDLFEIIPAMVEEIKKSK